MQDIAMCPICETEIEYTDFWFDDCDMVIKIPRFDGGRDFDYCARELHNYEKACVYRVERILLPIEYIGEYGAVSVYLQPRFTYAHDDMGIGKRNALRKKLNNILYRIFQNKDLKLQNNDIRTEQIVLTIKQLVCIHTMRIYSKVS